MGGRETVATSRDRTSSQANGLRCCGLERYREPCRSRGGSGEGASSEGHLLAPPCTMSMLDSLTSSYLIPTREETKLKVNTLEKPLSWDSNPDLSGSDTHALSSMQAAI